MDLSESLNNQAEFSRKGEYPDFFYEFSLHPEFDIEISCIVQHIEEKRIKVDFQTSGGDKFIEQKGRSTFIIFSTLSQIILKHIRDYNIEQVVCTAIMTKKLDIYEKLFYRFNNKWHIFRDRGTLRALKI
jgi:hypothetical protein